MAEKKSHGVYGVIYARYSSSGQREESIEGQLRDCREYAKRYGITIIAEYCDRAYTGTSDNRPEFQKMIRDSAKGQFSAVITWKNDRFARSRYDSAIYKYRLKQNGIKILYAKESIPEGPEGIILESLMEGFAEYYSANLSQNVKRGNRESALKLQTVGQTVFGLRTGADKRFEHDPETAPIVKRIFDEYVSGRSAIDIYTRLNAEGYRTKRGNLFDKSAIRNILKNEKYKGVYDYAGIRDEHGIPAIVDADTFDKAQKMIDKHHRAPAAKKENDGFLLTGKLFCGECGEPMTGDGGTSKTGTVYSYYTCNGRRRKKCKKERAPKKWIEDVVIRHLNFAINNDAIISNFADMYMCWQDEQKDNSEIDGLERRLKEVDAAIKNSLRAIDSGIISDSLRQHLIELEAEKVDIEKGIVIAEQNNITLDRDTVIWFLRKFQTENADDATWRVYVVETFLQAAYLYDDGRLTLCLNFRGEGNKITTEVAEKAAKEGAPISSNFAPSAAPNDANLNTKVFFYEGYFVVSTFAKRERT